MAHLGSGSENENIKNGGHVFHFEKRDPRFGQKRDFRFDPKPNDNLPRPSLPIADEARQ